MRGQVWPRKISYPSKVALLRLHTAYCNHGNVARSGSCVICYPPTLTKCVPASACSHVDRSTSQEDPRDELDDPEAPEPRDVKLQRDPQMGFGFVAGSEKPVIVRFVTESQYL